MGNTNKGEIPVKITKETLKEMIKEELEKALNEQPMMGTPDYASAPPNLDGGVPEESEAVRLAGDVAMALEKLMAHLRA